MSRAAKAQNSETEALHGPAEAERQIRVASRLYAASGGTKPWGKVNLEGQRPWIDRACQLGHAEEMD